MNHQFDELTKSLAQSVTRRAALKKFGIGLAGMALACFGLANKAKAATYQGYCHVTTYDLGGNNWVYTGACLDPSGCISGASADCPKLKGAGGQISSSCGFYYKKGRRCSFTV